MDTNDSTFDPAYALLLAVAKGWLRRHPLDLVEGVDDQARPFVLLAERAIYEAMHQ